MPPHPTDPATIPGDAHSRRREYLRASIIHEHLERVALRHPGSRGGLADGLSYASAISLLDECARAPEDERDDAGLPAVDGKQDEGRRLPGGLTEDDLKRYSCPSNFLNAQVQQRLVAELKQTLLSIFDFWTDEECTTEEQRLQKATELPHEIQSQRKRLAEQRAELQAHYARTETLVQDINEIHPRLEDILANALKTLPPVLNAARTARTDVLAMTIETCLLKLSLIRARAHTALYTHASPTNPAATMPRALAAAHAKLDAKRRAQDEEEHALDRQIAKYEEMLSFVDGDGGFAQVVKDMARVRSETEECRRDLRRLGWTGD